MLGYEGEGGQMPRLPLLASIWVRSAGRGDKDGSPSALPTMDSVCKTALAHGSGKAPGKLEIR